MNEEHSMSSFSVRRMDSEHFRFDPLDFEIPKKQVIERGTTIQKKQLLKRSNISFYGSMIVPLRLISNF